MKKKGIIIVSLAAAAVLATAGVCLYGTNGGRMCLGLSHIDKLGSYVGCNIAEEDWANPARIQEKTGPQILENLGDVNDANVRLFLQNEQNRLLLSQWMMAQKFIDPQSLDMETKVADKLKADLEKARQDNANLHAALPEGTELSHRQEFNLKKSDDQLAAMEKEAKFPHSLQELRQDKAASALLTRISNTSTWAEQFAFSNECQMPEMAVSILNAIAKKDPNFDKEQIYRDIATATALEFARYGWKQSDAVERYNFFATQYRNGNLNSVFDHLPFWQRRMVCGCKGDNDFGSIESLEWLAENVKLPADQYSGACWRCAYRLYNQYGDSIHGSQYVAPFEEVYGRNRARFSAEIGGVCGFLSHFGAFAALANGVPAMTSGEPGHCSYIVLVGDKWTPSYSLSWERGLHWQVWKDNLRFSSLQQATELFSDAQKEKTDVSNTYRVLAGELARQGKTDEAIQQYQAAVAAQPLHYLAWREYAAYLAEKAPDDPAAWSEYNRRICELLVPLYPELADSILSSHVYEPMAKAMGDNTDGLLNEMLRFWDAVKEMGPARWRIEELISRQAKHLKINEKDAAQLTPFARKLITSLANVQEYLPVVLGWANSVSAKLAAEQDKHTFLQAVVQALGDSQGEHGTNVLAPLILSAEKARDINTFQKIGDMVSKEMKRPQMPKIEPFPGKLMSEKGLVWTSSTCSHDAPCEHPGLLQPMGGRFHSAKEVNPYVAVQLTKQTHLNGIIVVGTTNNTGRLYDMHVQISESGKDDDWQDVAVVPDAKNRVMRIDLQDKRPLAKYVRVKRGGTKQEFFHLNAIYVYGVPAA